MKALDVCILVCIVFYVSFAIGACVRENDIRLECSETSQVTLEDVKFICNKQE